MGAVYYQLNFYEISILGVLSFSSIYKIYSNDIIVPMKKYFICWIMFYIILIYIYYLDVILSFLLYSLLYSYYFK